VVIRQERREERCRDIVRAPWRRGRPPDRDPPGGHLGPTGCVERLARCTHIALRLSPALSGRRGRVEPDPGKKSGL